jgi:hypothetical protein
VRVPPISSAAQIRTAAIAAAAAPAANMVRLVETIISVLIQAIVMAGLCNRPYDPLFDMTFAYQLCNLLGFDVLADWPNG